MAERDAKGRWLKGQSANPSGRPKLSQPEREARLLLQELLPENVEALVGMARHLEQQAALGPKLVNEESGSELALKPADELANLKLAAWIRNELIKLGGGRPGSPSEAIELNREAREEHEQALDAGDPAIARMTVQRYLAAHPAAAKAFHEESTKVLSSLAPDTTPSVDD